MSTRLYVGNLSFQTSKADLEQLFGKTGGAQSVNVVTDRNTGRSRGFAFVEMASEAEAQEAISQLDGKRLDGRSLAVSVARPREQSRGGGQKRGSGRQGYNRT
ncbi:MAG: RNA recognition motif domain-containing protein [Acidobacteriota bacterium]